MNKKCMISTQNRLHAWMPGTSMSINITAFPSEGRDRAGLHILTSVPENHYKPYTKKVMVVGEDRKTALVSWIWWVTNYSEINQGQQVKDEETDYWHTTELTNMNVTTNPGIQTRTKRVGKMMDRRWFRFHTAHVRSVRITVRHWYMRLKIGNRGWNPLSDTRSPKNIITGSENKLPLCQFRKNFTNFHWRGTAFDIQSSTKSPPFDLQNKLG